MIVCGVGEDGAKSTISMVEECAEPFRNGNRRRMVYGGGLEDRRQVIIINHTMSGSSINLLINMTKSLIDIDSIKH